MPPAGASVDRIMRAHFHDALLIREAVIAGRPDQAANPATVLALIENLDDLPAGWRSFVERMQQDARRITDSTSAAQAAAATADLGLACGLCHQQLGGPKVQIEPPPAEGTTLDERMQRHVWASERLWEGIAVPSADAWNAGARALSQSPFAPEVLKGGGVHAKSAASDFVKLVANAPTRTTPEARAALYAELLVTCGTCHRAMREARPDQAAGQALSSKKPAAGTPSP
jgi:cytochrome c556